MNRSAHYGIVNTSIAPAFKDYAGGDVSWVKKGELLKIVGQTTGNKYFIVKLPEEHYLDIFYIDSANLDLLAGSLDEETAELLYGKE